MTPRSIARAVASTLALALVAALGLAPTARAADATAMERMPKSYGAMMKMKPMDLMHMMDPGKTGSVTKEDFMKFHEAMFDRMDKNKDGKIAEPEWLDRSTGAGG